MKCEAIDARNLVRTRTIHLRIDPQFNLAGLIIPVGINIYDVPGRKSSGAMLPICVFPIEAVAIARTNCLLAKLNGRFGLLEFVLTGLFLGPNSTRSGTGVRAESFFSGSFHPFSDVHCQGSARWEN